MTTQQEIALDILIGLMDNPKYKNMTIENLCCIAVKLTNNGTTNTQGTKQRN
jgi:hypothetical protein